MHSDVEWNTFQLIIGWSSKTLLMTCIRFMLKAKWMFRSAFVLSKILSMRRFYRHAYHWLDLWVGNGS